jgi:hypothetical protein
VMKALSKYRHYTTMKSYVLIGFIFLVILVLSLLSRRERFDAKDMAAVGSIKNRLTAMEDKVAESDTKRKESAGTLNSTLR